MLQCFLCKSVHANSHSLIAHLRVTHSFYPSLKFKLLCAQSGCSRQFCSYSGFRKHLNRFHAVDGCPAFELSSGELSSQNVDDNQSGSLFVGESDPQVALIDNVTFSRRETADICASIVAKLQCGGVANSLVSSVVSDLEDLTTELHSQTRQNVISVIPLENPVRSAVEDSLEHFESPFSMFNTETKRTNYFVDKWGVVEPVEIVLGMRYDMRRNKKTGCYDQVPVKDTFVYVPILETLKFMCRNADVCTLLREFTGMPKSHFEDFCDGSYFQSHPLFSKHPNALQIQVYYDDFETANPLGSKRGVHKVGALYFVLRNLPPKFNSRLMNIHLIALFHAQDVKKYGFDPILEPLIRDIKILETDGIELPISMSRVYGTICQVIGDNLGMHSILGFTESFSGHYSCRLCLTEKDDIQLVHNEDDFRVVLRDRSIYDQHCSELESDPQLKSTHGLKRSSTLNSLQYFHVCHNYSLDVMHDLLEGVVQFEMKLLFEYLSEKFVTRSELLSRIYSYDYGYLERKNRPTKVNLEHSGNTIGLNSIQALCLVKNIPLLFGDIVPLGDQNWHLLLLLLQILNLVFSPCISKGMTVLLKYLTIEHHELFKELYPQKKLLPKHHFMVHYPACIRKIGPLVHMWSMRFEAKHKVFKNTLKNFKNITKSLAKSHQMSIGYLWETTPFSQVECGPMKSFCWNDVENGEKLAGMLQNPMQTSMHSMNWVKIDGTEYRQDLIVCNEIEDEIPVFSQIRKILFIDSTVYFIVDKLFTEHFSEHFHAFKVQRYCELSELVKANSLKFYRPFDLQCLYGSDDGEYVVSSSVLV